MPLFQLSHELFQLFFVAHNQSASRLQLCLQVEHAAPLALQLVFLQLLQDGLKPFGITLLALELSQQPLRFAHAFVEQRQVGANMLTRRAGLAQSLVVRSYAGDVLQLAPALGARHQ